MFLRTRQGFVIMLITFSCSLLLRLHLMYKITRYNSTKWIHVYVGYPVNYRNCLFLLIYFQQNTTLHSLFLENRSTCFGWYLHPSSGAHTTVSTAYGTCHTVTTTCHYHGRVGTPYKIQGELYLFFPVSNDGSTSQIRTATYLGCSWWQGIRKMKMGLR